MEDERIDFSLLDPSSDKQRWERMVESVSSRALQARRQSSALGVEIVRWARPAFALAATVALAIWVAALVSPRHSKPERSTRQSPGILLAQWAGEGTLPATTDILSILGEPNAAR